MEIAQEILRGNPRAIAQGISMVENNSVRAQEMMQHIFPHTGKSTVVGVTGAPGSGKSTLVDHIIALLRKIHKELGIIAVDPSSPFSGGAILGDRIRMMRHSTDPGIFIRSMATRGHLGGLAKATGEAIAILEASKKDIIVVETVGVGQDEVEVVKFADIVLVVLVPGAGDDIQAFKAGIMEIADIFVLNKADSPEADKTEKQIKAMLDLGLKEKVIPPVVRTIATEGKGTKELMAEVGKIMERRDQKFRESRKKRLLSWMLKDIIRDRVFDEVWENVPAEAFEDIIEKIYKRETDPYTVADEILQKLKGS